MNLLMEHSDPYSKIHLAGIIHGFSKSFDKVINEILVKKRVSYYGIHGNVSKWLSSYLASRRRKVATETSDLMIMFSQTGVNLNMVFHKT
jgi:hypothetical protein